QRHGELCRLGRGNLDAGAAAGRKTRGGSLDRVSPLGKRVKREFAIRVGGHHLEGAISFVADGDYRSRNRFGSDIGDDPFDRPGILRIKRERHQHTASEHTTTEALKKRHEAIPPKELGYEFT